MTKALVIFCDDFRIKDNPALTAASAEATNIIPFFVYDENYLGRKIGAAAKVFLHHVLKSFNNLLKDEYGASLVLRKGDSFAQIAKIIKEAKIDAVYFNESNIESQAALAKKIAKEFSHLTIKSFKAKTLFKPLEIKTGKGEYFKVFTPFAKECLKNISLIGEVAKAPKNIKSQHDLKSLSVEELDLLPKNEGSWHLDIADSWSFDYKKIASNIIKFLDKKLADYHENRNLAGVEGTSRISPYLRFGMISVRALFYEASRRDHSQQFLYEILWREYAYHVNFFHKNFHLQEVKKNYGDFEWIEDDGSLALWGKGKTGFDIVDAGMAELWKTGFMHNRVRMIAASFLIKDLLLDWKKGEQWFWECLVDADAAVNPFSWQWVFGSGFDAAPYFRIFNPDLQRQRFDPQGEYCKKWLPKKYAAKKIVDHDVRRRVALEKYKACRIV